MEVIQNFETINLNLIKDSINFLDEKFKNVEVLNNMVIKKKEEMDDEDKTEEFLNSFYKQAKETLNNLRKKRTTIYHTYDEISEFLGLKYVTKGNLIGIEQFISIMKEFFKKQKKNLKNQ